MCTATKYPRTVYQRWPWLMSISLSLLYIAALVITAAADIHPNPGPPKHPCMECNRAVRWNSKAICCDSCNGWYHKACLKISDATYITLDASDGQWICTNCGLPNFSSTLFDSYHSKPTANRSQTSVINLSLSGSLPLLPTSPTPTSPGAPLYSSSPSTAASKKHTNESPGQQSLNLSMSTNTNSDSSHTNLIVTREKGLIRILIINFQSMRPKYAELCNLLSTTDPDIVLGNETWLRPSISDNEIFPDNYKLFRKDRSDNYGGVLIAVKNNLVCSIINPPTNDLAEVTEFKEKYKTEAEKLVHEVFPKKIIYLQTLFQSPELDLSRLKTLNTDLNIPVPDPILINDVEHQAKRRKLDQNNGDENVKDNRGSAVMVFPNGNVPPNCTILELVNTLKPLVRELIDHANMIKMWLAFLIPKIEDGNNFGVSIQEDTLAETRQIETEVASYLDQISRYFITRGKLVSKVAKYPHVGDYRQSVCELDEKEFISLRLICCELRNHYATLHDLILKNIEKIRKPRNANAEALY